jgi:hypothetical protein
LVGKSLNCVYVIILWFSNTDGSPLKFGAILAECNRWLGCLSEVDNKNCLKHVTYIIMSPVDILDLKKKSPTKFDLKKKVQSSSKI